MANSSLVVYTNISKNTYGKRTHAIDTIIPHVIVGQVNVKRATDIFSGKGYKWSCNYTIGKEGGVGLVLPEEYASICTSNKGADERSITFEMACDAVAPYKTTNAVLTSIINLCTDICKRYGKTKLVWIADKEKNKAYQPKANEMKLSCHRFYAKKSCPGDYIYGLESAIAERVNQKLAGQTATPIPAPVTATTTPIAVSKKTTKATKTSCDTTNFVFNGVDMKAVFDADFYYNNYPDLQTALKNKKDVTALFNHFCTKGIHEARSGCATFSPITYKANYGDLAAAYGNNWANYYVHYILAGQKEGRKAY